MKNLLSALLLMLCTSCLATQAALEDLNATYADLRQSVTEISAKPFVTQEDTNLLAANLLAAREDMQTVKDAMKADVEAGKNFISGLSNAEAGVGGLGLLGLGMFALDRIRDGRRRKRKETVGTDSTPAP